MSFSQSYFHGRTSSEVCELQTSQKAEGPGTGGRAAGHEGLERGWEGGEALTLRGKGTCKNIRNLQ